MVTNLLLKGSVYLARVTTNTEDVFHVYIVQPDKVVFDKGSREYRLKASPSIPKILANASICKVTLNASGNPFSDCTPVNVVENAIQLHNAINVQNLAILKHSALVSSVFNIKGPVDSKKLEDLKVQLQSKYVGVHQAGQPMIVSGDIDWKQVTKSQDLDFSDSKAGIEREIAQAFGVPPILLGIKDGVHSHYEQARMQFWHETLIPMATRIINDLQHWLGGGYMHFSLDLSKVSGLRNVDLLKSVLPTIMNSNTVDSTLKTKITNEVLALLGMSVRTEPTDVSHEGKSDYVANMCARNGK